MASTTQTFPFARLPAEFKLQIFGYHTLFLRDTYLGDHDTKEDHPLWTAHDVTQALSAFTYCGESEEECFHPSYMDLARIHFPTAGRIFSVSFFKGVCLGAYEIDHEYASWLNWEYDPHCWEEWKPFCRETGIPVGDAARYLRFLAHASATADNAVRTLGWYCDAARQDAMYTGLLLLFRFTGGHIKGDTSPSDAVARFEYYNALASSQQDSLHKFVDDLAWSYARRAADWAVFPFASLINHYHGLIDDTNVVTRDQFIDCGALATCIKHFILRLNKLDDTIAHGTLNGGERRRRTVIGSAYRPSRILFDLDVRDSTLVLTPRPGSGCALDLHRLWFLERRDPDTTVVDYRALQEAYEADTTPGTFTFDIYNVVRRVEVFDGLQLLSDYELTGLFREAQ